MNALSHDSFQQMCDHISEVVDPAQYERMRWARDIGPRLAELVSMTLAAIEPRVDLELTEEQSSTDMKRFVLKVHGIRVIGLTLWIEDGQAHILPAEIERSRYRLTATGTLSVELDGLDAEWIAMALRTAFGLIENREQPRPAPPPAPAAGQADDGAPAAEPAAAKAPPPEPEVVRPRRLKAG